MAQTNVEKMLAGYATLPHGSNFSRFEVAQLAGTYALLLIISILRGFPERAMRMAEECVAEALRTKNALTVCSIVSSTCITAAIQVGDYKSADRYTSIVLQYAERSGLSDWYELGQSFEAVVQIKAGNLSSGVRTLNKILNRINPANLRYILQFAEFSEALAKTGEVVKGMAIIDQLLGNKHALFESDQLRRKARITRMSGSSGVVENAERMLWTALEKSRRLDTRFFELLIAMDLAALLEQRDRREFARDLLGSVYEGFSEGFDTEPLVEARAILERLQS